MSQAKVVAAVDIGSSKISTIISSYSVSKEAVNISGVSTVQSRGLRKSQIIDIEQAVEAITESVEGAERMAGMALSSAFVAIGGTHISSVNSKGVVAVAEPEAEITQEDIKRVLESARAISLPSSKAILHVIPRNFTVDSQSGIKDPLGMTGVRLEVEAHIVTGATTSMRNLTKCINEIGIEVEGLVFAGLASGEAVLSETEKELGVCLVDIGGGTTDIGVYQEGSLAFSSVLPVGANNVTNDLAIGLRVSLESAEKIKKFLGREEKKPTLPGDENNQKAKDEVDLKPLNLSEQLKKVSRKTVVEGIIRPRLNETFSMVGQELKKSGFGGATPAGIVLTGGGAETVKVVDSCKRVLSLPTRVGMPKGIAGLVDEIESPAFAASVGLVLYGVKHSKTQASRFSFRGVEKFVGKIPVKGVVTKAIDFVKSFLP
jgi:cell division protein FtsA